MPSQGYHVTELHQLSAADAALAIREGRLDSVELVRACLARIAAVDPGIGAWTYLDPDYALRQAADRDEARRQGRALGPLHGVPVGIKDIFDTADMPTENGSVLHAGRQPRSDSAVVARLRAAGAVIMGKTVTTEFAYFHPGKTKNPHHPERTPGGSSSGSAASVAAEMVPIAIGSQTNGSMIRPASFCGVVGFKPSYGLIPRTGVQPLSGTLDHVGTFSRTVEDAALLAEVLAGRDEGDPQSWNAARPPLFATATSEPPLTPRLAFVKTPVWDEADADTKAGFAELVAALGDDIEEAELGPAFAEVIALQRTIMDVEMADNLRREYAQAQDQLSEPLRTLIERGRAAPAIDYVRAVARIPEFAASLDPLFEMHCDAIVTPAAVGEATEGLHRTGNPIFATIWTYLGMPAITLPLLTGANGLPIGVQLVARRGDDARLLRTANWLVRRLSEAGAR
jgi:Asp-tRNA(Asn)/Glu-tRNA(Gln) amidotransferase A subunit family amidase